MMERCRQPGGSIRAPADVVDGLEQIRQIGAVNMLDRPGVIKLARLLELDSTADWIETHQREYAEAIFRGLESEEDDDGEASDHLL